MSSEPREYLRHILVEVNYLISQRPGLKFEDFIVDETLRRAVVRSLEIIGEAAKKVPSEFRAQHPTVEWRAMAGMRDRLRRGLRARLGRCSEPHSGVSRTASYRSWRNSACLRMT